MYYLTQINGKMISGAIITKQPPTKGLLEAIYESAQDNDKKTIPPDKLVVITTLSWGQIVFKVWGQNMAIEQNHKTIRFHIRKYLDKLNEK